jgi:hypothetical protein
MFLVTGLENFFHGSLTALRFCRNSILVGFIFERENWQYRAIEDPKKLRTRNERELGEISMGSEILIEPDGRQAPIKVAEIIVQATNWSWQ